LTRRDLTLLLGLHLAHHRRAAAGDLLHPDVESQVGVLGEAGRGSAVREGEAGRHGEAIFAAFAHPRHRFGKAGEDLVGGERLGAAMRLARIDHRAVVGGQDVIEQRRIGGRHGFARPFLHDPELQPRIADLWTHRSRTCPGKARAGANDQQECKYQLDGPAAAVTRLGGGAGGHLAKGASGRRA